MNTIDIYCRAIKRTFADFYGVAPDEVDVSWSKDDATSPCAVRIKPSPTKLSNDDDEPTLEFVGDHEDPVTVRLTDDERLRLERTDLDHLNGY